MKNATRFGRFVLIASLVAVSGCATEEGTEPGAEEGATDSEAPLAAASITYGSSAGDDTKATISLVQPKIIRVYDPKSPTQLAGQATTVPKGTPMHYSCKPSMTALSARNSKLISDLKNVIASIPEVQGSRVTIQHEFDNNGGGDTPAIYQAGWKVFLSDVLGPVNAKRKIKLISVAITTPNPYFTSTMDQWFIAGADEIGTDAYSTKAIQLAAAYAKSKGKPWSLPEYGYSVKVEGTDAEFLARMKADEAIWSSVSNRPKTVIWYNANHNILATRPKAAAWWKNLTAR